MPGELCKKKRHHLEVNSVILFVKTIEGGEKEGRSRKYEKTDGLERDEYEKKGGRVVIMGMVGGGGCVNAVGPWVGLE